MSSDIIYKGERLISWGISFLSTISDKMFDLALEHGHLSSEPIVIFISSMQSSSYYSLGNFSVDEIKLFRDLFIQAFNQMDTEGWFDLHADEIQDRIEKKIALDIPREDKKDIFKFIKSLEEIINELEIEKKEGSK